MPTAFFSFSFFLFLLIKSIQFALRIGDLGAFNVKGTDNRGCAGGGEQLTVREFAVSAA